MRAREHRPSFIVGLPEGNEPIDDDLAKHCHFVGILVAVSALALAVFTIGAAIVDGSQWVLLVVIVPMGLICWVQGLEVGRFAVPAHRVQLDAARTTLTTVTNRITNIRAAPISGWTENRVAFGYRIVAGSVTGAVVQVLAAKAYGQQVSSRRSECVRV